MFMIDGEKVNIMKHSLRELYSFENATGDVLVFSFQQFLHARPKHRAIHRHHWSLEQEDERCSIW
jgi:hypothetical protein